MILMSGKKTLMDEVFKTLLLHPGYGSREMAEALKANYGSVKDIYSKLYREGLLTRESRGRYALNIPGILADIYTRLERQGEEENG